MENKWGICAGKKKEKKGCKMAIIKWIPDLEVRAANLLDNLSWQMN